MCVRIALITPEPCEARAFTSDEGATFSTVNQPQTGLAGVAEPTDPASRLIADAQLDNGSPLMLGVATPKGANRQAAKVCCQLA